MKNLISERLSGYVLIIFLLLISMLHFLILLRIVPYDLVWGGKIQDPSSVFLFEMISLFMSIAFILIIATKIGYIKTNKFNKTVHVGIWFITAYFLLNSIANFASEVYVEKMFFAPLTVLMTLFALRLAIKK